MNTPIARLTAFRDYILATDTSMNASRFEQLCGLANGYFKSHASYNNERGISTASVAKVKAQYPQLNVDWVITGNGHMLIGTPSGIPLYTIPFTSLPITPDGQPSHTLTAAVYLAANRVPAGSASRGIASGGFPAANRVSAASASGNPFACIATDPAMLPDIPLNATVILTPADPQTLSPSYLAHPFAIVLTDGSRLIRHIATYTKRTVTLAPTAKTPAHAPLTIPLKDIIHLYKVTAVIRLFTRQ